MPYDPETKQLANTSGPLTDMKLMPASLAIALASKVLPQPGGPHKSTPDGAVKPKQASFSGYFTGAKTASFNSSRISCSEPISSQLTSGTVIKPSRLARGCTTLTASRKSSNVMQNSDTKVISSGGLSNQINNSNSDGSCNFILAIISFETPFELFLSFFSSEHSLMFSELSVGFSLSVVSGGVSACELLLISSCSPSEHFSPSDDCFFVSVSPLSTSICSTNFSSATYFLLTAIVAARDTNANKSAPT
uniref:Uncharacterized protein n=1 Tax=Glossina pallidipes TaxID=7398 RepID=A0A1B0A6C8_GLOPL